MRFDEYDFAKPYLAPDETVLWQGTPRRILRLSRNDLISIAFGLLWCGTLAWAIFEPAVKHSTQISVVSIIMLLFGFVMMIGRVFYDKFMLRHTAYVITTRKIIRRCGKKVETLDGSNLPEMRIDARADGSGTVYFGHDVGLRYGNRYRRRYSYENTFVFAIENVDDVATVQKYIYQMKGHSA
ncbi:MAG: hypothetical protein IJY88_02700 [Clostridia bacterium]|nr:hypothetical protein [Clostridia bacterium]